MRYKVCSHCDSDFLQVSPNQKYCSVRCKEKGTEIVQKKRRIKVDFRVKNAKKSMEWKKKNYIKTRLDSIRHRAIKQNLPFNLTEEDIVVPELCPVFGFPMDGATTATQWSFDRLKPELGYVQGNVRIISVKANRLKNNATLEDLEKIVSYMKKEML